MTLTELMASYRQEADDFKSPPLTSPKDQARFFAEAEEEACIRKRLIYDESTAEIVEIDVTEAVSRYPRDPRMFEVMEAWLYQFNSTSGERLVFTDRDTENRARPYWRSDRCRPSRIIVDDTSVFFPCVVNGDYTLKLEGYRTPLVPLSLDDTEASPEISPIHHRYLVHWVLYRAYSKQDSELFDKQKAATELRKFEDYFGTRLPANAEQKNQADRPHHVRAYW
jgi:hypothetical protein